MQAGYLGATYDVRSNQPIDGIGLEMEGAYVFDREPGRHDGALRIPVGGRIPPVVATDQP